MAIVDPFSSERIVDGKIVLEPYELIPDTILDDDPTEVESDVFEIPDGDAELVFLCKATATLSPTSVEFQFLISYDGTNFYEIDGQSGFGDWSAITVLLAAMPYAEAVIKGRMVAPYGKVKAVGAGTDASNKITVNVQITRKPQTLDE